MLKQTRVFSIVLVAALSGASVTGCSLLNQNKNIQSASSTSADTGGIFVKPADSINTSNPTADAVTLRIMKGIGVDSAGNGIVGIGSGNFRTALAQLSANLPSVSDPSKASGINQIPLLVFAACSDANPTSFGVSTGSSVATNMAALVKTGVTMVNNHVGGIAGPGTALNTQVTSILTTLINSDVAAGATTAQTFVSVCLAANSFGVSMLGF